MSRLEPEVQAFLVLIGAFGINLLACEFGWNIHTAWMRATRLSALQTLGATCPHSQDAHEPIAGRYKQPETFEQDTACYPEHLAEAFVSGLDPMLSDHHSDLEGPSPTSICPPKGEMIFPKALKIVVASFPGQTGAKAIDKQWTLFIQFESNGDR